MKRELFTGIKLFIFFTLLLGILYPLLIMVFAQVLFPHKSAGSIVMVNGFEAGSELIGQKFSSDRFFNPRPSAINYNPVPSGASNLSQSSKMLNSLYKERENNFSNQNHLEASVKVPTEMLFASASGVDPHISPEAAVLQINRISIARNFDEAQKSKLFDLVNNLTESPKFGFLGKSVVNVLILNIELDKIR